MFVSHQCEYKRIIISSGKIKWESTAYMLTFFLMPVIANDQQFCIYGIITCRPFPFVLKPTGDAQWKFHRQSIFIFSITRPTPKKLWRGIAREMDVQGFENIPLRLGYLCEDITVFPWIFNLGQRLHLLQQFTYRILLDKSRWAQLFANRADENQRDKQEFQG